MKIALPTFPVEGGCVCGVLSYTLKGPPLYIVACHCLSCQCLTGSDYSLGMFVRRQDFVVSGTASRCERTAESGRIVPGFFCPECGTRIWHEPVHSPNTINIRAGTLDDPSWAVPIGHIWVERKKPHVVLDPDAILVRGQPGDRQMLIDAWARATARI